MSMADEQLSDSTAKATEIPDSAADELTVLRTALHEAQVTAKESREQQLRALAELDNVRKRAARDVEQAHKYGLDKVASELIGVKDSLELGLAAGAENVQGLLTGMEATLQLLSKAFTQAGIVEIEPQGQVFNPELHEAMAMQATGEQAPNTVLQVIQKGYQLNGRLLRPARVIVARAAE